MRERGRKCVMRKRGCGRPSLVRSGSKSVLTAERLGELSGDVVLSFPGLILMDMYGSSRFSKW
jgi:hypothetical protein